MAARPLNAQCPAGSWFWWAKAALVYDRVASLIELATLIEAA